MHYLLYPVLFSAFAWTVLTVNGRRRVLALGLGGVIMVTLVVIPAQAKAQAPGGIIQAIQAVLKVLNSLILPVVHGTRSANSTFYQTTVWPVPSINQANSLVLQMIGQYRSLIIITTSQRLDWLKTTHSLRTKRIIPTVFMLDPITFGGQQSAQGSAFTLQERGITCHVISRDFLRHPEPQIGEHTDWKWRSTSTGHIVPTKVFERPILRGGSK